MTTWEEIAAPVPAAAGVGRVPTFMRTATTDATTARAPTSIRQGNVPITGSTVSAMTG